MFCGLCEAVIPPEYIHDCPVSKQVLHPAIDDLETWQCPYCRTETNNV
jgi:hypothetical protein